MENFQKDSKELNYLLLGVILLYYLILLQYFIVVFHRCKKENVIFIIEMLLIKFMIFLFKFRLFIVFLETFSCFSVIFYQEPVKKV